jgi:UDP-glucose 4-epimerase
MSKAIVIGGAGFIGSNLVDYIIDSKSYDEVVVVDDMSTGREENLNDKAFHYRCDFGDTELYCEEFSDADVVFHLAAKARVQPSIQDPVSFDRVNVHSLVKLLKGCVDKGVKNFVFSSSSSVYGDTEKFPTPETAELMPMSPYGLQKLIGEQYCKLFSQIYKINTCCLRYFNVYGERMLNEGAYCLVMGTFDKLKKEGKPLTIYGDGSQLRDFTYVKDVAKANVLAAEYISDFDSSCIETDNIVCGEIYNIGNGDNRSIQQIADIYGGPFEYLPARLEPFKTLADNSQARSVLKWRPSMDVEAWLKKHLTDAF